MASNGNQSTIVPKTILQSEALHQYILETSVYPREHESMKELRELTQRHSRSIISTEEDQLQFLNMLVKLLNVKKAMEVGVFTGQSLLATALALPNDGEILAIDINRENYDLGLPIIKKAGVANKINFREGQALSILEQMIEEERHNGSFDFIFMDADKENYLNYHEKLIQLVKIGGVIVYDNTLWRGSVVGTPNPALPEYVHFCRDFVVEFNKALAADPRVEICQLSVGDGMTLARRVV